MVARHTGYCKPVFSVNLPFMSSVIVLTLRSVRKQRLQFSLHLQSIKNLLYSTLALI